MNKFNIILFFFGLLLVNCREAELMIPVSGDVNEVGVIDLIAKPIDVQFVPEYDYGYTIKWPVLSDKVKKVLITYTEKNTGELKSMEFTELKSDFAFSVKEYGEYTFNVQAFDADGNKSRVAMIKSINKDLYARQLLNEAQVTQFGRYIRLRWSNILLKDMTMSIKNSLINQSVNISGAQGEQFIPILDNGQQDLVISLVDKSTGLEGSKSYAFKVQGVEFPVEDKRKWTIFYDAPYNDAGWWNVGEAFDGDYTRNEDLHGTAKLNAVSINGVTKLNSDRRIRTVYFTFTQKRANSNDGDSQYNTVNRSPAGPYDNILVQKLSFVFKAPKDWAVWPSQLKVYGIKSDGTEVLITTIGDAVSKMVRRDEIDPDHVKMLVVDVPQNSYDGATFKGIKAEITSSTIGSDTNSDNWENIIGLGEVYVTGVKTSM
ncbi:hypothetical protein [Sphingobacterium bovistauri]|uniref:DUF4959 domain-containing protein n=1 Tax=Sphingobacterium bovistauri TaxID=2781959 RepID=A0ABS7Z8Q0_9SPHI|nr:hypothetical protein [Sphingobacterium bovistauri]MCA5005907.1 hypothetical protein [Sphingobacterium bovistauri]